MAVIYLSSVDGNDADDGSTWALAKATLASALTAAGAGGTVYMDNAHAETQATAMTLTSPGTETSPVKVLCSSRVSGAPPTTLATTGTVSTTGNNNITFNGVAYCYGVTFTYGNGANPTRVLWGADNNLFNWIYDTCTITKGGTTLATNAFTIGSSAAPSIARKIKFINSNINFGATGDQMANRGIMEMSGGAIAGTGSVPTTLVAASSSVNDSKFSWTGVDLSTFTSGKTLFTVSGTTPMIIEMTDCKLGASVTITTGTIASIEAARLRMVNCDSGDTNYRYYKKMYQGEVFHESTIVRTGGASDGVTPISRKMVSTTNNQFFSPLYSDWILFWNETTSSSLTATIETVTDNVTLTDAEAWIEIEYLGTSGVPQGNFTSDRAADILTTGANQTSSSATWTTTGLTTPVKQKLSQSFTPQKKGPIRCRVALAKASTTMYFCPKVDIT